MGGPYSGGGPGLMQGHSGGQAQAMMRMLDMSASNGGQSQANNGGGYPRSGHQPPVSPGDPPGLLSTASPLGSPRSPRPASPPQLSLGPGRPPASSGHLPPGHHKPLTADTHPHFSPGPLTSSASSLPLFSSSPLAPDPFSALQDLRLSHPSISQWLQHQVSAGPGLKPEPVSPRLEQNSSVQQPPDYQRNQN